MKYFGSASDLSINDKNCQSLTKLLVPLGITFLAGCRIINAVINQRYPEIVTIGIILAASLVVFFLGQHMLKYPQAAIVIALLLYSLFITSVLVRRNFSYFFSSTFAICFMMTSYLDSRKLLYFIITTMTTTFILVILCFPSMGGWGMANEDINLIELMIRWAILLYCVSLLYLLTRITQAAFTAMFKEGSYMEAVLSATPDGMVLLDKDNRVAYLSDAFIQFINLENHGEAIGRPLADLINDDKIKKIFNRILKKKDGYKAVRKISMDGKRRYFRIISNIFQEKTMGRYIIFTDITAETTAKLRAEDASKSKSAFLATMSHEIRTPLNAVIGLSEIELQHELPDSTRDNLEKIYNAGSSLLSIINDILDISKIEAGNLELVPVIYDTANLIDDTVRNNIIRIGSKNIVFDLFVDETVPAKLYGDELRVKQIINNLLSNAFKYTSEGKVRMEVYWEKEGADALLNIMVSDTGQGIKQEDLDKLFIKYCQFDTRANRNIEGTGLGLPIAKQLTETMNGFISVHSDYGQGSTFRVRIRQALINEKPIGGETAQNLMSFRYMKRRRIRSMNLVRAHMPYGKVLIVDDVQTNLDVITGLLLPYGLSIDCAASGREAIEKLRLAGEKPAPDQYDLVFMDHMMPEMDGIEAVRIIRNELNSDYTRSVPVIALTANALSGNREMFLSNGFNGFISKPVDIMKLDAALNSWIRNKQSSDTLLQAETTSSLPPEKDDLPGGWQVAGIDLDRGQKYYSGGKNYIKVLQSFCAHTPALLEKLRNLSCGLEEGSSKEETLKQYAINVHGLKGSCYGICADDTGALALALENAAKSGDIQAVRYRTPVLIALVEKLIEDIGALMETPAEEKKLEADVPDMVLLNRLFNACRYYRISEMEEIMTKLESFEYASGGDAIQELRELMDNLEYEAMTKFLEEQNTLLMEELR